MGATIKVIFFILCAYLNLSWALPKGCSVEIVVDPHFHQFYTQKFPQK